MHSSCSVAAFRSPVEAKDARATWRFSTKIRGFDIINSKSARYHETTSGPYQTPSVGVAYRVVPNECQYEYYYYLCICRQPPALLCAQRT